MAVPSTESNREYNALLTTTLENWLTTNAVDQIKTDNAFLSFIMNRSSGYKLISSLGERATIPLRYALGTPDSYGDYDTMKNQPYDGMTRAYWDWRQASDAVQISGMEEAKNSGEEAVMNLLEEKKDQVMDGFKEWFAKAILQGQGVNDGSSLTSAYVSPNNGSTFVDPLPLLVKYDPTTSTVIGNINQSTYSWWQNKTHTSTATDYAGFLKELDELWMDCGKGPGGKPDFHLVDENVFRLLMAALRVYYRNTDLRRADVPFENVMFKGRPVIWDEFMADIAGGSTTLSTSSGSWFMLNSSTFQVQAHRSTNFRPTPFRTPTNQDSRLSHVQWKGAVVCSARRKNGVMGAIDTTITS